MWVIHIPWWVLCTIGYVVVVTNPSVIGEEVMVRIVVLGVSSRILSHSV